MGSLERLVEVLRAGVTMDSLVRYTTYKLTRSIAHSSDQDLFLLNVSHL
jgi:hypothetical protein